MKLQLSSCNTDVKRVYAVRCGEEGGSVGAGQGAPLPAHCLTGALIPAESLSRRHFVHKVRSARVRILLDENAYVYFYRCCIIQISDMHFILNLSCPHYSVFPFRICKLKAILFVLRMRQCLCFTVSLCYYIIIYYVVYLLVMFSNSFV